METLKYKIIKNIEQYNQYCFAVENILANNNTSDADEIELLTYLIEKWDNEHNKFEELNPIELLHELMFQHNLKAKDLVEILGISKGLISDILHYKKGLSKEIIRKLSAHFSLSQEAFNRPYKLINTANIHLRNASVMNTKKEISPIVA